jgi:hypothetical protein
MPFLPSFLGAPFRRVPSGRWFQPFAKVVSENGHHIQGLEVRRASEQDETFTAEFKAERTGRLYLFVDDAVIPPGWRQVRSDAIGHRGVGAGSRRGRGADRLVGGPPWGDASAAARTAGGGGQAP